MRRAAAALTIALCAAAVHGQSRPALTKPPDYDQDKSRPGTRGAETPSEELKTLREEVQTMRNQSYGYRAKADELRDTNHYDEAEALDDHADELDMRALDLERRAEREELRTKGPFHPTP